MPTFKRFLSSTIALTAIFAGLFIFGAAMLAPTAVYATAGVAVVNLNTPIVSGSSVSGSGTANSGLKACVSCTAGEGLGGLCNCCTIPPIGPECSGSSWKACPISAISYKITNSSGVIVAQGNTTYSGTTCTDTSCHDDTYGSYCTEAKNFNVPSNTLAAGNYTMTVTANDCVGATTDSRPFSVGGGGGGAGNPSYTLTVSKNGSSGGGTVSSSPAGVNCGSTCSSTYTSGTSVTLSESPNASNGSTWGGWGGACSGTGSTCTLTMNSDKTVTALFNLGTNYTLTVNKDPASTGGGSVSSNPAGISMSASQGSASASFSSGTDVTLTASPNTVNGSSFTGWGGACSGTGPCLVSMNANKTVSVRFDISPISVSCSASPANPSTGQSVTWTAAPSGGSSYTYSWSGTDSLTGTSQSVSKTYSTTGAKSATVTVTSGGQTASNACNVTVGPSCTTGTITVSSNLATTYSLSGPTPVNNASIASGGTNTHNNLTNGTYTITPATVSGYTYTVSPSTSQTLNCNTSSFTITYSPITPPSGLSCTASPASFTAPGSVTYTASGGSTYSWSTPGGSPASGSGSSITVSYGTAGTKTATVTSGGTQAYCSSTGYSTNQTPQGVHETNDNAACTVQGWAYDPDSPSQNVNVQVYSDNTWKASGVANIYRSDKTSVCTGGLCGFLISLSGKISTGVSHNITVKAVDAQTSQEWSISGTPKTITCSASCTGTVVVNSNVNTAWSLSGPTPQTQPGNPGVTTKTYAGQACGAYTLSPWALGGYGNPDPAIAPAASQTLTSGGTITYNLTYTASGVDIKANGSDAPSAIPSGTSATLTWTTSGITAGSCSASSNPSGWSGAKADNNNAGETSPAINSATTFTLTCSASGGGTVTDSVTVPTRAPQCSDGVDNDGDRKTDYPNDPGCQSPQDDSEEDLQPECSDNADNDGDTLIDSADPGCHSDGDAGNASTYNPLDNDEKDTSGTPPECNDGLDNDGDGKIDYPADDGCSSLTDPSEKTNPNIREI